ncbi:unnamed protein product [Medioppia subpectinata]|uniref:NR LBD domain-containing protein n=1 Tax=Medioppia subpectinata TaxID=1979941 RepID=A0A7R9PVS0_9ACAR|nr:unnamed protein product [Medioppia subpectinata]CAG2102572.1 unnamed protein product [Medioppia subpectinata]
MFRRNFSALTCDSCRAFFRRYALKNEELIRSNDENQLRRLQLLERKQRLKLLPQNIDSSGSETIDNLLSAKDTNELDVMFDLIQNTLEITNEELNKQITEIENKLTITTKKNSSINQICHKYGALTVVPIFQTLTDYNGLNQLETRRVSELLMACKVLDYPMARNSVQITDKLEMIRLSTLRSENQIQDLITFSKGLTAFSDLCFTDQLALIKYGSLELMQIGFSMGYDIQNESFTIYLDSDNSIFTAIILFNPNRPNLTHRHNVGLEQQLYIYLLQRYLLLKYQSESESQTRLQTLMNLVNETIIMREFNVKLGLEEYKDYTNYFGPLVKEINFFVFTCDSCRAFFRRYALKNEQLIRSDDENQLKRLLLLETKSRQKSLSQNTDSSGSDTTRCPAKTPMNWMLCLI